MFSIWMQTKVIICKALISYTDKNSTVIPLVVCNYFNISYNVRYKYSIAIIDNLDVGRINLDQSLSRKLNVSIYMKTVFLQNKVVCNYLKQWMIVLIGFLILGISWPPEDTCFFTLCSRFFDLFTYIAIYTYC